MIPAHPTVTPPQSGSGRKKHARSKAAESAAVPRRYTHIRLLNGNLTAAVRGARGDSPLRSLGVAQGRFSFGKRIALAKCAARSAVSSAALGGKKRSIPDVPEYLPNGVRQPKMLIPPRNGRKPYVPLPEANSYAHRKAYKWLSHGTSGSLPKWHPAKKEISPGLSAPYRIRRGRCPNAHYSPSPEEQNA